MFGFQILPELFLACGVIVWVFPMLSRMLAVRKGWTVELVALFAVPLALFVLLSVLSVPGLARPNPYLVLQFVWVSAVVMVGFRLLWARRVGAADLFRLTLVVALAVAALSWAPVYWSVAAFTVTCCCIYCAADLVWGTPSMGTRPRNLALVAAGGFVLLALLTVVASWQGNRPSWMWAITWADEPQAAWLLGAAELLLVNLLMLLPRLSRIASWPLRSCIGPALSATALRLRSVQQAMELVLPVRLWQFEEGVCYLNHGSFGAVPINVRSSQRKLRLHFEEEPMDFMTRNYERMWLDTRRRLSAWIGAAEKNVALVENATAGMNEIASWFPLEPGDEVLLSSHEYGAVFRTWQQRCASAGASVRTVALPLEVESEEQVAELVLEQCTEKTRLVVISHFTSATAIRLPVELICERLARRFVPVCIDGPHAPMHEPLALERLGCDFYTASCHKWLCAPVGAGFLYVAPKWHAQARPLRVSWGRLSPEKPSSWDEELIWSGTRDSSALIAIKDAIEFWGRFDSEKLDARNHGLAKYARERLLTIAGTQPLTPDSDRFYRWMVSVKLPSGDHCQLQKKLWERYRIEVPVFLFEDFYLIRVSCPLYVCRADIDYLIHSLNCELS